MKRFYESIGDTHVISDENGHFGYSKNLSKYYLTCISYVPSDSKKKIKSILSKPDDLLTEEDRQVILDEQYRQNAQSMFERVCMNQASNEDREFVNYFIKTYPLEDLVKSLIPIEFDNVYEVANNYSSLEINELIKFLRKTFNNSEKVNLIISYLHYCLDDKKIRQNLVKKPTLTDIQAMKAMRH